MPNILIAKDQISFQPLRRVSAGYLPCDNVQRQELPPYIIPWPFTHVCIWGWCQLEKLCRRLYWGRHLAHARKGRGNSFCNILSMSEGRRRVDSRPETVEKEGIEDFEHDVHIVRKAAGKARVSKQDYRVCRRRQRSCKGTKSTAKRSVSNDGWVRRRRLMSRSRLQIADCRLNDKGEEI